MNGLTETEARQAQANGGRKGGARNTPEQIRARSTNLARAGKPSGLRVVVDGEVGASAWYTLRGTRVELLPCLPVEIEGGLHMVEHNGRRWAGKLSGWPGKGQWLLPYVAKGRALPRVQQATEDPGGGVFRAYRWKANGVAYYAPYSPPPTVDGAAISKLRKHLEADQKAAGWTWQQERGKPSTGLLEALERVELPPGWRPIVEDWLQHPQQPRHPFTPWGEVWKAISDFRLGRGAFAVEGFEV